MQNIPKLSALTIGGATYDLFLTMSSDVFAENKQIMLRSGGKLRVKEVIETCGGGASNTAVGLSRLGLTSAFCGVVGTDQWGDKLLGNLQKEGVDISSATVVEHETSSFSIILSLPSGERTILYAPGVNEHLHDVTFDVAAIASADVVYLNHLSETSCMIENNIVSAILARPKTHLTWNPGGCQIEAGVDDPEKKDLLSVTDMLLLNKEEAMTFTKTSSMEAAMELLIRTGAKNICITDGKSGTTATDGNAVYHCPVLEGVETRDTTGAGDAFGTGVTWALSRGESLQIALIAGTLNAASVVGAIGAQAGLLTETAMRSNLKKNALYVTKIR